MSGEQIALWFLTASLALAFSLPLIRKQAEKEDRKDEENEQV